MNIDDRIEKDLVVMEAVEKETRNGVRTSITGTLLNATMDANSRGVVTQSVAIEAPCENPGNPTYDNTNAVCVTVCDLKSLHS